MKCAKTSDSQNLKAQNILMKSCSFGPSELFQAGLNQYPSMKEFEELVENVNISLEPEAWHEYKPKAGSPFHESLKPVKATSLECMQPESKEYETIVDANLRKSDLRLVNPCKIML